MPVRMLFDSGQSYSGRAYNGHYFLINHQTFEVSQATYVRMVSVEAFYLHIVIPTLAVSAIAIFTNRRLVMSLTEPSLRAGLWPAEDDRDDPSGKT